MKISPLLSFQLFGCLLFATTSNATVINLFSNAGDESVFGGGGSAITNPIPDPLTGSGWGVMSGSGLDGDALRLWDTDNSRATLRHHQTFTSGVQYRFDGLIESGGPAGTQNLWRIGSSSASLAGGAGAIINMRLTSDGNLVFGSGNTVYETVAVGLDTRFSVSVVINAGNDVFSYDENGVMVDLDSKHFSMYINDSLIGTWESEANDNSNVGRVWFLTGNAAADAGPTMQIDNYEALLGDSITAIPEPRTYALFAGLAGLGVVLLRRRNTCKKQD